MLTNACVAQLIFDARALHPITHAGDKANTVLMLLGEVLRRLPEPPMLDQARLPEPIESLRADQRRARVKIAVVEYLMKWCDDRGPKEEWAEVLRVIDEAVR